MQGEPRTDQPSTDQLIAFVLDTLSPAERAQIEAQIAASPELAAEVVRLREDLTALPLSLPPATPPPALKARLLRTVGATSRFTRFADAVARLLGVAEERARAMLAAVDDSASWVAADAPGVALYHLEGQGVPAGAVVGFIRIAAGSAFPEHEHLGEEVLFVIQGGFADSRGATYRVGDEIHNAPGSQHRLLALAGPDTIFLSIAYGGVRIGDKVYLPGDEGL